MASNQIGEPSAVLFATDREFDPQAGFVYVQRYNGSEAAVRALETGFIAGRARTRIVQDGPHYILEVRTAAPQDGSVELPIDKWEFDTDFVQDPIWSGPKIIAAAAAFGATQNPVLTADDVIKQWRDDFKTKSDAKTLPKDTGFTGDKLHLYVSNVVRGQEAIEVERAILTRVRSFSATYAGQVILDAVPKVYTTGSLISLFAIPPAIANRLPGNPAYTPLYTAWGWKKRKDSSEFILAINKVQETKDFVFAAWDTLSHDII
jgi:hypothetical protein